MTNQQPWKAIVNPTILSKVPQTGNSLSVVNKNFTIQMQKSSVPVIKFAAAKRYSFDDNGGGYRGL